MNVIQIVNSVLNSNTYIISKPLEAGIWLVDAGDPLPIIKWISEHNKTLRGVFLTHTHYDHIYGLNLLYENFPDLKVYTSQAGELGLYSDKYNFSKYYNTSFLYKGNCPILLNDQDIVPLWDNTQIKVLATPGHDKSCLCYVLDESLFSGDSYIPGIKVVTSFPLSNKHDADASEKKILEYPNIKYIYPGHGNWIKK